MLYYIILYIHIFGLKPPTNHSWPTASHPRHGGEKGGLMDKPTTRTRCWTIRCQITRCECIDVLFPLVGWWKKRGYFTPLTTGFYDDIWYTKPAPLFLPKGHYCANGGPQGLGNGWDRWSFGRKVMVKNIPWRVCWCVDAYFWIVFAATLIWAICVVWPKNWKLSNRHIVWPSKKTCLQYLPLNYVFSFETLLTFYDSMSNGDVGWMILPVSTDPWSRCNTWLSHGVMGQHLKNHAAHFWPFLRHVSWICAIIITSWFCDADKKTQKRQTRRAQSQLNAFPSWIRGW